LANLLASQINCALCASGRIPENSGRECALAGKHQQRGFRILKISYLIKSVFSVLLVLLCIHLFTRNLMDLLYLCIKISDNASYKKQVQMKTSYSQSLKSVR